MPTATISTKFYHYRQNNSGGSFDINDKDGIGVNVWVEGTSSEDADSRADRIGIYFDGCDRGMDCDCCGDRWSRAWEDGKEQAEVKADWDFMWDGTVYIHRLDGTIERIKKPADEQSAA